MLTPCVICNLELDNSKEPGSVEFESGANLRNHLVEYHSKYVACALLAPNINNNVHFWLLNNVDYNPSLADLEMVGIQTKSDLSDNDQNQMGLSLLTALISASTTSDQLQNANQAMVCSDNGETTNKQSPTLHDLFNFNPLTAMLGDAISKMEVDSNPINHEQSKPDATESKAMRKTVCQVCDINICSTARQRHVFMVHLNQKDLFQCSKCDYTNSNSIWELKKHCISQHGSDTLALSNEEKHQKEIQMWNQKCFPDWKQKKTPFWLKSEEEKGEAEEEVSEEISDGDEQQASLTSCLQSFIQRMSSLDQSCDSTSSGVDIPTSQAAGPCTIESNTLNDKGIYDLHSLLQTNVEEKQLSANSRAKTSASRQTPASDRICHICWEESRYPGRHIAQKHLCKPLYECPVCEGFGSYESCTVMKHINKVHVQEATQTPDLTPISNLERYAEEIRELQMKCFPNRPMKLARLPTQNSSRSGGSGGSRPARERHHCNLCQTLVAQSDRQRHVYHRHLKKTKIFECPLCEFSSNYDVHRVKWHIKWIHKNKEGVDKMEPISHENKHRLEIDQLNEKCFPGWLHRKRPFWWLENREHQKFPKITNNSSSDVLYIAETCGEDTKPCTPPSVKEIKSGSTSWTCNLCKKEFKPSSNFLRHVAKEHLKIPLFQCPVCEGYSGQDAYDVRAHIQRLHPDKNLEPVSNVEDNADQIVQVYQQCFPGRKLKSISTEKSKLLSTNVPESPKPEEGVCRVQCKECNMDMKTEDRQIHVYRHHLKEHRLYECPACDFSHHACSSDVKAHIRFSHREIPELTPRANLLRFSKEISEWNDRCFPGWINRRLPATCLEDFNRCKLCDVEVRQTSRHIAEVHLHIPLHQCPLCEYGAAESRLVSRHMKNNHKKKEIKSLEPIANVVKRRASFSELHDQCFPGRPKRLTNITISDEGRRTKCKLCSMTISKKRRGQHLLEKHLCKSIYKCKLCQFYSHSDKSVVETHISEGHPNSKGKAAEVSSELIKYITELKELAKACFNDVSVKFS